MTLRDQIDGSHGGGRPEATDLERRKPKPLYVQLRPRRNGLDHDTVASNQRGRLFGAMIEEVAERGYDGATLARLVALAGVSKRAFHEQFGTKQAYFLATYDAIVARAVKHIGDAYRSGQDWEAGLRRGFQAFADEVANEPKAARLVLVEVLGAGPDAVARMRRTRLIFERMISASFNDAPDGAPPPLIVKGIVCGVERVTCQRLLAGSVAELPALAGELAAWAVSCGSPVGVGLRGGSSVPSWDCRPPHMRAVGRAPCQTRVRVRESDRTRILRSAVRIAAATGYARLTPAQIACAAGVSERTFDELFDSAEHCFLDAIDRLGLEALVCAAGASRSTEDRLAGVHRGVAALMLHIAANPAPARVAFVEIFALGPTGLQRRERMLDQFTDQLARATPRSQSQSRLAAEASVGAIWGIVHDHVTRGATDRLTGLAGYASRIALAPVIGGDVAAEAAHASKEKPRSPAREKHETSARLVNIDHVST